MTTSLHTKYRPKTFKEIVGHKEVVKSLRKVLKEGRMHAFILTGPAGTGKTTLARLIANHVCGGTATAANIEEIPAAIFTGVDAMRSITDKAKYKAIATNPTKVFILDEAHRLSKQSWDSLLKAIEEPQAHVYWVFATTESGKIPKTIQTRCVSYTLSLLDESEILKVLTEVNEKENLEVSTDILELISEEAGGSFRQALAYLEQCAYCEDVQQARVMIRSPGQSKEVIDLARLLVGKKKPSWGEIVRILTDLKENNEAESIRINLVNYFAVVIMGSKRQEDAFRIMAVLEEFSKPYNSSEKFAPLLLSIGNVLAD